MADFLDEAMGTQPLEEIRRVTGREVGQMGSQVSGSEATDCPFAAYDGEKQPVVLFQEQIEAAEGAAVSHAGCGDPRAGGRCSP